MSDPTRGDSASDKHRARRDARRAAMDAKVLYAQADTTSDPGARKALIDSAADAERDAARAQGGLLPESDSPALVIVKKRVPE